VKSEREGFPVYATIGDELKAMTNKAQHEQRLADDRAASEVFDHAVRLMRSAAENGRSRLAINRPYRECGAIYERVRLIADKQGIVVTHAPIDRNMTADSEVVWHFSWMEA
jgi:hypothetical protein